MFTAPPRGCTILNEELCPIINNIEFVELIKKKIISYVNYVKSGYIKYFRIHPYDTHARDAIKLLGLSFILS